MSNASLHDHFSRFLYPFLCTDEIYARISSEYSQIWTPLKHEAELAKVMLPHIMKIFHASSQNEIPDAKSFSLRNNVLTELWQSRPVAFDVKRLLPDSDSDKQIYTFYFTFQTVELYLFVSGIGFLAFEVRLERCFHAHVRGKTDSQTYEVYHDRLGSALTVEDLIQFNYSFRAVRHNLFAEFYQPMLLRDWKEDSKEPSKINSIEKERARSGKSGKKDGTFFALEEAYRKAGITAHAHGELDTALKYFMLALENAKSASDSAGWKWVDLYARIGAVFLELGDIEQAKNHLEQGLDVYRMTSEYPEWFPPLLKQLGAAYKELGDTTRMDRYSTIAKKMRAPDGESAAKRSLARFQNRIHTREHEYLHREFLKSVPFYTIADVIECLFKMTGIQEEGFPSEHLADVMIGYTYAFTDPYDDEKERKEDLFRLRRFFRDSYLPPSTEYQHNENQETLSTFENIFFGMCLEGGAVQLFKTKPAHPFLQAFPDSLRRRYFPSFLIALHQRYALRQLAQDVGDMALRVSEQRHTDKKALEEIHALRKKVLNFLLRFRFTQISDSSMHTMVYERWRTVFRIEELLDELKGEVYELDEFLRRESEAEEMANDRRHHAELAEIQKSEKEIDRRLDETNTLLTITMALFFPLSLLAGIMGMNIVEFGSLSLKKPLFWLISGCFLVAYFGLMKYFGILSGLLSELRDRRTKSTASKKQYKQSKDDKKGSAGPLTSSPDSATMGHFLRRRIGGGK